MFLRVAIEKFLGTHTFNIVHMSSDILLLFNWFVQKRKKKGNYLKI